MKFSLQNETDLWSSMFIIKPFIYAFHLLIIIIFVTKNTLN